MGDKSDKRAWQTTNASRSHVVQSPAKAHLNGRLAASLVSYAGRSRLRKSVMNAQIYDFFCLDSIPQL